MTYATLHCNAGALTHWVRPGTEPPTSWFLVRFVSSAPQRELLLKLLNKKNFFLFIKKLSDKWTIMNLLNVFGGGGLWHWNEHILIYNYPKYYNDIVRIIRLGQTNPLPIHHYLVKSKVEIYTRVYVQNIWKRLYLYFTEREKIRERKEGILVFLNLEFKTVNSGLAIDVTPTLTGKLYTLLL